MAYATTNPPVKISDAIAGGPSQWAYASTDVDDTVIAAGYVTNALNLGMRVGDRVDIWDSGTPKGSIAFVTTVTSTGSTMTFAAVA